MTAHQSQTGKPESRQADLDWLYGNTSSADAKQANHDWLRATPAPRVKTSPPTPPPQPSASPQLTTPNQQTAPQQESRSGGKQRHPVRRVAKVVGVVLVLWLLFLLATPVQALMSMPKTNDVPSGTRPASQPGTAILLVGTDSREGLTAAQRKELGTGDAEGSRTDVMLIYYVPPTGQPALISLPRDSYLPIPGHKSNKLNAAYAFGGPTLLIQTVEQATGLRLDGYLEIGFGGFVSMVDSVGGVQVCLDAPMKDKDANINLPKGCQTLDGVKALGYVRQRHQDPLGDLGRVQRQREIITKVIKKLATPATVLNPVRYWRVTHSLASSITRGQDTSLGDLFAIARSARALGNGKAISLTVPISNANATTSAGSSVLWNQDKAKTLFGMLARGDTSQLDQFR